ncbi:FitA-like ribbon-helix-helix domain-containing protein [Acidisphaera sp. L21]|uniref:FitA-like ribbon-helix-helix domain-containing protein n=1 Tax=Acidisphaera sp. L21 TaxID=1641851 RepID=UPI00131E20C0|nr:Arc family DNA-binding protein [Acidisphaera sp. L21]
MPVNLSIKNAPDDVVERLRRRAARNHRSLQGELLSILEDVARIDASPRSLTVDEIAALAEQVGPRSPSSVEMIREDRDR